MPTRLFPFPLINTQIYWTELADHRCPTQNTIYLCITTKSTLFACISLEWLVRVQLNPELFPILCIEVRYPFSFYSRCFITKLVQLSRLRSIMRPILRSKRAILCSADIGWKIISVRQNLAHRIQYEIVKTLYIIQLFSKIWKFVVLYSRTLNLYESPGQKTFDDECFHSL